MSRPSHARPVAKLSPTKMLIPRIVDAQASRMVAGFEQLSTEIRAAG